MKAMFSVRKYQGMTALVLMVALSLFQNCGASTSSRSFLSHWNTCAPLMSVAPASSALVEESLSLAPQLSSSIFKSAPASGDRRIVLDDFLTRSGFIGNMTGALTGVTGVDTSGKLTVSGTSNSTYGLVQLNLNAGIQLPLGSKKLILNLQVLHSNSGTIVSPIVVLNSSTSGLQYLNLLDLTCGSTYPMCNTAEDYYVSLDPTQSYSLQEIHLTPAGVSGAVQDYSVLFRGLSVDVASNPQVYSSIHGPLVSVQKFDGELGFNSVSATTLTVKTAVYPYLKELLYQTPGGNFATQNHVTATASSSRCYTGGWCVPAINAILPGTNWSSVTSPSSAGASASTTYQLDFDQVYSMNVFMINIGNHGAPYRVQISKDHIHWVTVYADAGGTSDAVVAGRMSDLTMNPNNQVASLRILYSRPTLADSDGLYDVTLSGMQLFEDVPALSNGLMPAWNVDNTQATHIQKLSLSLASGYSALPISVDGLGPGEYVLQTEVSQGGVVIAKPLQHFTLTRTPRVVSDSFFGINDEFFDHQDVFVNQLQLQASRVFVNWPSLQTTAGTYSLYAWPGYDSLFQRFSHSGTKMRAVINHVPSALSTEPSGSAYPETYPPTDLLLFDSVAHNVDYGHTEFYKFVKAYVTAYRPWLSTVEIMNEFDINDCVSWKNWQGSFAGSIYNCSGGGAGVHAQYTFTAGSLANRSQEYMELLRAGYLAVKDVDPTIQVTHAGLATIDEQTVRNLANYTYYDGHKGSEFFDVYNFHQYWANEAPELSQVDSNSGGTTYTSSFETFMTGILAVTKGELHKDSLMTEFGYDDRFGGYTSSGLQPPSTRKEQAVFNARAMMMFKKMGITQAFPFEAIDLWSATTFFGGMGVLDLENQAKDWFSVFQLLNEQFSGYSYVKTIERAPHRIEVFQNAQGLVRAFVFKLDSSSGVDEVTLSSPELLGGGSIRRVTPLLNQLDRNLTGSTTTQTVPYLNPMVVEVGPELCQ